MLLKGSLTVNPLRVSSALLLALSPLTTWITIVSVVVYQGVIVFGAAAQSNLWMVSTQQLGTNISPLAAASSVLALLLVIASGLAMLKSAKLGVPLGIAGMAAYLLPIYPVLGETTAGLQQTFVSPGIGFFVAGAGVLLGSISSLSKPGTVGSLLRSLKTQEGLSKLGVSVSFMGLTLDVANHTVLGQLPDFVGSVPIQWFLHLGLTVAISTLLVALALGRRFSTRNYLFALSIVTLLLLGGDAAYSVSSGNLHDFLGHNLTETVLHLSVYYGVALTAIGGFIGMSRKD